MSDATSTFDIEQHRLALIEEQQRTGINDSAAAEVVTIPIAKGLGSVPDRDAGNAADQWESELSHQ